MSRISEIKLTDFLTKISNTMALIARALNSETKNSKKIWEWPQKSNKITNG